MVEKKKITPLEFAEKAAADAGAILAGWDKKISENKPKAPAVSSVESGATKPEPATVTAEDSEAQKIKKIERSREGAKATIDKVKNYKDLDVVSPGETTEKKNKGDANFSEIRQRQITQLRKEVADERRDYLEMDYKKNKALDRVRKYFSSPDTGGNYFGKDKYADKKKMKNYESDEKLSEYRAYYDNKLMDLQKLLVEDAKESGASDEELAKLFVEFRIEQKITLAEDHDKVKIEQQDGKAWGYANKKLNQLQEGYKSLPTWKKLGIGACFAGAAVTAGSIGAAAVTAVAGAAAGRRIIMGVITGVGTAKWLESHGQKKDRENVEKERQEFLRKLDSLSEEEKYKLLSKNIKDIAIKDFENTINKVKNQDIKQLAAGVAVGTFIGRGMASDIIHKFGELTGWWGHTPVPVPGHINPHEHISVPAMHAETLTIEKGSSFEGTITKYLNLHHDEFVKHHPDLAKFDNAHIAHRLAIDFKDAHPEMEQHLPDYVRAGAKMYFNPDSLQMEFKDFNDYSWFENVSKVSTDHINHGAAATAAVEHVTNVHAAMPLAAEAVTSHGIKVPNPINYDGIGIGAGLAGAAGLMGVGGAIGAGIAARRKFAAEDGGEGVEQTLGEKENVAAEQGANNNLRVLLREKNILDGVKTSTNVIKIKNEIFGKNEKLFQELIKENVAGIMKSEESKEVFLKKLPKSGKKFFSELIKQVPPKAGDTILKWLVRVVFESKKIKA